MGSELKALLRQMSELGVELSSCGGQLKANAPPGVLTVELRAELTRHKNELLALLESAGASGWSALIPIRKTGSAVPLFLVHGAGGNILLYKDLVKHLGRDQPVFGFQARGLDGVSQPLKTIEEMAEHYLEELREVRGSGPYRLGGYCMGGMVALEMARRLTEIGERVDLLALLDVYNPAVAKHETRVGSLLQRMRFHAGNFARLSPSQMGRYMREKIRIAKDGELRHILENNPRQSGIPRVRDAEIERGNTSALNLVQQANDKAADEYIPKRYGGKVVVFKPRVNYESLPDPKMGWEGVVENLEIVELDMNPHAMLVEPFVRSLAEALASRLR